MLNTQHKPWAPVSLGAVYMITITILHTYVVFETDTQFTFALVLLVRSDAALANQTAASKTLVNSLNDEWLLLWLHCYDYDAESLIMVINVIKVKKNNFEHFFYSSFGDLTAFALVDVFCLPKYFGNFDRKAIGRGESSIWHKFYSFPSQIAVNRVWNWWKLENGTHISILENFPAWK